MKRTVKKFLKAAIAALDEKYELVYVSQGDHLSSEQVGALVSGDFEKLWDLTSEFESQSREGGIDYAVEQVLNTVVRDWEREDDSDCSGVREAFLSSEHMEELREAISERDSSDWAKELADATPPVLLRILVDTLDEDNAYSNQPVDPAEALTRVGLPITDKNVEIMADTLANASPEFSVLMGYWIVGADVGDFYAMNLPDKGEVLIHNPHLYLGSPFAGSGFISQEPFEGVVRVARENVKTDKEAFGYSVENIYGGLNAGDFAATLTPLGESKPLGIGEPAPVILAARAGDGDVTVTVAFVGPDARQVVLIDTEERAKFQVIVNGKPITLP